MKSFLRLGVCAALLLGGLVALVPAAEAAEAGTTAGPVTVAPSAGADIVCADLKTLYMAGWFGIWTVYGTDCTGAVPAGFESATHVVTDGVQTWNCKTWNPLVDVLQGAYCFSVS